MDIVAMIPARAGSRRLPGKNLLPLLGKPLLAYTCDAARDSGVFSAIYVNTDSEEIARVATRHGAECPVLRPAALARDETPTRESNLFLLRKLDELGRRADALMILQPTSPLRTPEDIRDALRLFEQHEPCAVVSVSPVAPESWCGRILRDGCFERFSGDDPLFRLNGAIYVHGWDEYAEGTAPRQVVACAMPARRGLDIDTREDLDHAAFLLQHQLLATPA